MTQTVDSGQRFPLITQEALDALRSRIGQPFKRPVPHVTEATADSIRHWALGIGDDNPLWLGGVASWLRGLFSMPSTGWSAGT